MNFHLNDMILSCDQVESPVFQFMPAASCPVIEEEPGSLFFVLSRQIFILIGEIPPRFLFLRLNIHSSPSLSSSVRCSSPFVALCWTHSRNLYLVLRIPELVQVWHVQC